MTTSNRLKEITTRIKNIISVVDRRLKMFLLETLDSVNRTVFNFSDASVPPRAIYRITHSEMTPVKSLRIVQLGNASQDDRFITICEVETYGGNCISMRKQIIDTIINFISILIIIIITTTTSAILYTTTTTIRIITKNTTTTTIINNTVVVNIPYYPIYLVLSIVSPHIAPDYQ